VTDHQIGIAGLVFGIVSAVVGGLLSWYFYNLSRSTRIPTFLVDPARAVLADGSGAETDITILYKGNGIGQKAVNVVRVYFWNAGNTPIIEAAKDILERDHFKMKRSLH
jgi:hypothetical protein